MYRNGLKFSKISVKFSMSGKLFANNGQCLRESEVENIFYGTSGSCFLQINAHISNIFSDQLFA